jgi:hypothetical protein
MAVTAAYRAGEEQGNFPAAAWSGISAHIMYK